MQWYALLHSRCWIDSYSLVSITMSSGVAYHTKNLQSLHQKALVRYYVAYISIQAAAICEQLLKRCQPMLPLLNTVIVAETMLKGKKPSIWLEYSPNFTQRLSHILDAT